MAAPAATAQTASPRAILVKFVSRRSKARVMEVKKRLKNIAKEGTEFPSPVFISDDLTKRRSRLAWEARKLKREKAISDTWVYDTRVLVKNNHGVIRQINSDDDLEIYKKK